MQIWKEKTIPEIIKSMEMEIAKAKNELRCAEKDMSKAQNRIAFTLSAIHNLKDRDIKE
jgi:septal ring factor EnvC (AmiA/AmiB activator)